MTDAVTRLIAVRHGETAWNRDARIQGHTDSLPSVPFVPSLPFLPTRDASHASSVPENLYRQQVRKQTYRFRHQTFFSLVTFCSGFTFSTD